MPKTPIKVLIRSRPTSNFAHQNIQMDQNTGKVNITIPKADQGHINHQQESWGFEFNKVLVNASQQVVFNLVAKDILLSALEGYSGCIMCYGQTGAGKTFTMTGARNDYKYRGIIPRMISNIFQEIGNRYEHQIKVYVSYLELYNETLIDLLTYSENGQTLSIQEDAKGYVFAKGQTMTKCQNEQQALQALFSGQSNRTIAQHKLNQSSSRSHTVFTIHLQIRSKVQSSQKVIMSKINLVDLAGSERTKKTGSEGKTLVEAQFINKSLSFLQQLVIALSEKKREHIPYRQNKLTYLLKDSIGGNSKTYMIANIWPQPSHMQQTISTLKFASRMMKVSNQTSIQMNLDPSLLIKKYQKEIKELKQELAMHDTLVNRGRVTYEPYTSQQQYEQQVVAKDFLQGKIDDIQIQSLRQVRQLFLQFRNLYRNAVKNVSTGQVTQEKQEVEQSSKLKQTSKTPGVGVQQNKFGFGVGKATKDSKPAQNISNLVNIPKDEFQEETEQIATSQQVSNLSKKIVNINKNQAYQQFKGTAGKQINDTILKNNDELKQKRQEIKRRTQQCQALKNKLEDISQQLKHKEDSKTPEELNQGIIDEQEFQLLKKKKQTKRICKQEADKIKAMRSNLIEIDANITSLKTSLLQKFEQWFFKRYGIQVSDLENPLINRREDDESEEQRVVQSKQEVDEDALAYIKAKKKVSEIHKAMKQKY